MQRAYEFLKHFNAKGRMLKVNPHIMPRHIYCITERPFANHYVHYSMFILLDQRNYISTTVVTVYYYYYYYSFRFQVAYSLDYNVKILKHEIIIVFRFYRRIEITRFSRFRTITLIRYCSKRNSIISYKTFR